MFPSWDVTITCSCEVPHPLGALWGPGFPQWSSSTSASIDIHIAKHSKTKICRFPSSPGWEKTYLEAPVVSTRPDWGQDNARTSVEASQSARMDHSLLWQKHHPWHHHVNHERTMSAWQSCKALCSMWHMCNVQHISTCFKPKKYLVCPRVCCSVCHRVSDLTDLDKPWGRELVDLVNLIVD